MFVFLTLLFTFVPKSFAVPVTVQAYEVSVTSSATVVPGSSLSTKSLLIVNKGSDIVRVKADSAPTGTEGVPIPAGGSWEPAEAPTNTLYIKADVGPETVLIYRGI